MGKGAVVVGLERDIVYIVGETKVKNWTLIFWALTAMFCSESGCPIYILISSLYLQCGTNPF